MAENGLRLCGIVFGAIAATLMSSTELYFFLCGDSYINLDLETPGLGLSDFWTLGLIFWL